MKTVIGLGSAGCNVAELFENQEGYNVKLIDAEIEGDANCISVPARKSSEEYEETFPDISKQLEDCGDRVFLILGGSGKISGASLKLLKQLKRKEINVVYIKPDISILGNVATLQEKVVYNVFQEYARSGMFNKVYLINNSDIENILGDIPIIGYYEAINKIIFNAINTFFILEATKPVIDNSNPPKEISRICTFGVYDLEKNIEKLFYPFNMIDDKCYNFFINENSLKNDGKLFKLIKERMKEKIADITKISYKIFSSSNDINYCYVTVYSRKIQE